MKMTEGGSLLLTRKDTVSSINFVGLAKRSAYVENENLL